MWLPGARAIYMGGAVSLGTVGGWAAGDRRKVYFAEIASGTKCTPKEMQRHIEAANINTKDFMMLAASGALLWPITVPMLLAFSISKEPTA